MPCYATQKWFDLYPEDTLILPPVKRDDRDDTPAVGAGECAAGQHEPEQAGPDDVSRSNQCFSLPRGVIDRRDVSAMSGNNSLTSW